MIVNTAYIYMGSGGAAVNPNLWQDGVSNYPVVFSNSSISSAGLQMNPKGSYATFSELPLPDFNSLTLSATAIGVFGDFQIIIEFFNSAGQSLETVTAKFPKSGGSQTVNVPSSAKIENAKIKITNKSTMATITIQSALLS